MRETQVLERAINGVVRHREPELLVQSHDQIAGPPSHDTVDRRDRSFLYDPSQKGTVCGLELGWHAGRWNVNETIRSLVVEPNHPVPQRLPIHPANLGCLGA